MSGTDDIWCMGLAGIYGIFQEITQQYAEIHILHGKVFLEADGQME